MTAAAKAAEREAEPKHTPGPLKVSRSVAGNDLWAIYAGKHGNNQIATTIHKEDAELFAAAPDMLAALKACLARLKDCAGEWEIPLECEQMALAAIAKAEGRS